MAEARSGPPPVPPRIDLGESEDTSAANISDGLPLDSSPNIQEPSGVSTDMVSTVIRDEPKPPYSAAPSKPPVLAKPQPPTVIKANKPKLKTTRSRPEISIISARPMDQSNSTNSTDERGIPTPQTLTNNNLSNKPVTLPRADLKAASAIENQINNSAPSTAPKKPLPYDVGGSSVGKPSDSLASNKVARPPQEAKKKGNTKKDSSSIFYVDTNSSEEKIKKGAITQVTYSKKDDKLNVKVKPAPRKNKSKPEQAKKVVEPETSPVQPEVTKPKPKPTIITSKKPKMTTVAKETTGPTSAKEEPSLDPNTSSILLEAPVEETPPGRPNVPPSAEVNESLEATQPQRPKAPPNSAQEEQKIPVAVKKKAERQKDIKNTQKRPKSKPPRPPMSKDSGKHNRPAPAQPNVASKKSQERNAQRLHTKTNKVASIVADEKPKQSGPARATAKFDYNSESTDDLSFKVGDTIMLISKVDDWFVGYLENNVMHQGLFPSSFVDIVVYLKEVPEEKAEAPSGPYAIAVHDFQGQSDGELSFSSGQTIILTERINEEWLKGQVNQTVGIFPQNFVHVERDLPKVTVSNPTVKISPGINELKGENPSEEWCRATHDYHGDHDDDLSFVVGNEIRIIEKIDNDWFRGVVDEKTGIFPAPFVEIISQVTKSSKDIEFVTGLHDYHGETDEDLSFSAGDKIKVVERINSEWLLGELNGKEGLFPVSFVENFPKSLPQSLPQSSTSNYKEESLPKNTRFVKAIHDFNGEHSGELHFQAGDIIEVVRDIDSSWCEGIINNLSGIFPSAFVEMEQSQETSCAKALYDYKGETAQDLSFKAGDVIQLLERVNEDWWTGSLHEKTGQFPATFVEELKS